MRRIELSDLLADADSRVFIGNRDRGRGASTDYTTERKNEGHGGDYRAPLPNVAEALAPGGRPERTGRAEL